MECCAPNGDAEYNAVPFTLLDADFFDDSVILLVYRFQERPGEWTALQRGDWVLNIMY